MKRLALILILLLSLPASAELVLVLRSWPRDPDLPQNLPDTSLPSNWDAAADHTPADNAALQALLDGNPAVTDVAAGEVIELDADVDYGTIVIDASVQGDADNWIIIRTDEYASLPAYGSRVVEADATYMATFSKAPDAAVQPALWLEDGDSTAGASYIRFIGIQIKATGSGYADTNYIGPMIVGDGYTYTPQADMPEYIGFDRCIFTVDDEVNPWGITFDCQNSFVVGSCFHNFWGGGNDGSNALRSYTSYRNVFDNNSFECMGAALFLGDNNLTVAEDIKFSNNYVLRPSAWNDEMHGTHKASFEFKTGLRCLVERNVFDGQYNVQFETISVKAEGTGGPKSTRHITIRGNKITNTTRAISLITGGSSNDEDVGPNRDILVEDNLCVVNVSDREALRISYNDPYGVISNIQVRSNTFINTATPSSYLFQSEGWVNDGTKPGVNYVFRDNIAGYYKVNGGGEGSWALNWSFGSTYVATHNLWVGRSVDNYDDQDEEGYEPLGTLTNSSFPANPAAVGYTDYDNGDYSISNGSEFAAASSTGGKPGYDSATYDPIWAGVEP